MLKDRCWWIITEKRKKKITKKKKDNHQLENILHRVLGDTFCGVWASDQLALLTRECQTPSYFIVNTHPSHLPGEHWLALTLEEAVSASFFDYFGFPPDFFQGDFLGVSGKPFRENTIP